MLNVDCAFKVSEKEILKCLLKKQKQKQTNKKNIGTLRPFEVFFFNLK